MGEVWVSEEMHHEVSGVQHNSTSTRSAFLSAVKFGSTSNISIKWKHNDSILSCLQKISQTKPNEVDHKPYNYR